MTQIYIKQNIHKHRTQHFRRISPFGLTPVEKAHKARTRWYRRPFRLINQYQVLRIHTRKNGQKQQQQQQNYINVQQQIQVPYGSTLHIPPNN